MNENLAVEVVYRKDEFRKGFFVPPASAHYRSVDCPEETLDGEIFVEVQESLDKPLQFRAYFVAARIH